MVDVAFRHKGITLRGVVHEPKKYDTAIVLCHGFPGDMNGTPKRLCNLLGKHFLCLRFSFSGSPPSDGTFENKTMSGEANEIRSAIRFLKKNYTFKKLILADHSTGAIDAALYAYRDKRVHKLVLLGMINELDTGINYDFSARQVRDFWTKGYVRYCSPGTWVHGKKIKKKFYDEFFNLSIKKCLKKFKKPVLIIHGECDKAIPVDDAKRLAKEIKATFRLVKGAGHSFKRKTKIVARTIKNW